MGDQTPEWRDDRALGWAPDPAHAFAAATDAPVATGPWSDAVVTRAEPELTNIARLWPLRLVMGLAQGLLFFALFHSATLRVWPGADPYLFSALGLAGLFVPLMLLEGVGTIAPRRLLPFAGIACGVLALLGWYHHWRGGGVLPGGMALMLCALALVMVQAALHGRERGGHWRHPYAELFVATWILFARLLMWAWVTLLAWLMLQSAGLSPERGQPLALLFLALASAAGFQLSAALPRFTSALADMLAACATALLPLTAATALLTISLSLAYGPAPLLLLFLVMAGLLVTINASHRGDEDRKPWRDGAEVFGSVLLLILAGLALWVLEMRVGQHGWTGLRILAVVTALIFGGYGAGYSAAALSFLLRGHGLTRIQRINRLMAVLAVLAVATLLSPLGDPHRIAAQAQVARLEDGRAHPDRFDFVHLQNEGTRFGRAALATLSLSLYPDIARAAQAVHGPISDPRAPDQIGPNIHMQTAGAHLPATLLTRDWSPVLGAPACLTRASTSCDAHALDINQDGQEEILLVTGDAQRWWAAVLEADLAGRWRIAGRLTSGCGISRADLAAGRIASLGPLPGWDPLSPAGTRPGSGSAPCTQ